MSAGWGLVALGIALAVWFACRPLITNVQRQRRMRRPVPPEWESILELRAPVCARLPHELRDRLYRHMQVFLAEKRFFGCNGLTVTEEMRVTVAALGCLLTLNREADGYERLQSVLLYPDAFVVRRGETDEAGVHWNEAHALSGESWDSGKVILSWADVCAQVDPDAPSFNVTIHEFAHQLDNESGPGDGVPLLSDGRDYAEWVDTLGKALQELRDAVAEGRPHLLDDYAAETPAEFFAVATEVFFERPVALLERHPELYRQLSAYYELDPATWPADPAAEISRVKV